MATTTLTQATHEVYSHPLTEEQKQKQLTARDRCDRCGSQAYYMAFKGELTPLLFCRHHYMKAESALKAQEFSIIDQSFMLTGE